ncbi:MAG: hypothetical protein HY013_13045 [Candidatus Solibacter usitatus]|nr:hypothetical protein [Candidatus Solibacter usitatus]
MGEGRYIQIPGSGILELPPLLVHAAPSAEEARVQEVVDVAAGMIEEEEMIPFSVGGDDAAREFEQRKFDLALHLADRYFSLVSHWLWGDSVLEWVRQCEITFDGNAVLRPLLHPDVWPHAGRSSFVALLVEKNVPTHGVGLEKAVGLRLTFRQPPPIECFSDQFLFYLNSSVAGSAYQTWSHLGQEHPALLPPERFHFQVHELN